MLKLDVTGIEELASEFERLASDEVAKYEREAVKAGAEIVKKQQEENWNRSGADGEHIKDNVTIGRAFETEEGTGISIGPKMSLRWRAIFVEYGTSRQPPQAPIRKSLEQSEQEATKAMMKVLERVVR